MQALGVYETLAARLVQGNNIAQTYQFVMSRNAALGFVAGSQVITQDTGSSWRVPEDLHDPIRQMLLLEGLGQGRAVRGGLVGGHPRGPEARGVIERFGYGVDVPAGPGAGRCLGACPQSHLAASGAVTLTTNRTLG